MRGGIREFLPELIERVESGDGRDRVLDRDIWIALGWAYEKRDRDRKPWLYQPPNARGYSYRKDPDDGVGWALGDMGLTASVDAVLSLIDQKLSGWCWEAKRAIGCHAIVWQVCKDYDDEGCKTVGFHMSSAPRALLAACLRALLESLPEHADANSKSPIQAREE